MIVRLDITVQRMLAIKNIIHKKTLIFVQSVWLTKHMPWFNIRTHTRCCLVTYYFKVEKKAKRQSHVQWNPLVHTAHTNLDSNIVRILSMHFLKLLGNCLHDLMKSILIKKKFLWNHLIFDISLFRDIQKPRHASVKRYKVFERPLSLSCRLKNCNLV